MRAVPNISRSGEQFLYFRYNNKSCSQSIRAKVVFDQLYKEIDKLNFTEKEYEAYKKSLNRYIDNILIELRNRKRSLTGQESQLKASVRDKSKRYAELSAPEAKTPQITIETLREDIEDI